MNRRLYAGVARCDVTPPVGIAHGTWSAQVHERAEGIDLPLWCSALAVSDGQREAIIAEWDLVYPPDGDWLTQTRKRITDLTGVPGHSIRISASHTHAGPSIKPPWFAAGTEMIGPYVGSLTDRLAGACLQAHRNLEPALLGWGKGSCGVNCNRRLPQPNRQPIIAPNVHGFTDHEVGVLRIDREDSSPLAVLAHYSAHPTILAWDNRLISPDYPGTLRRTVESLTGSTCLFLQGAAGNQDTIRDFSNKVEDARWVGRQIGLEAVRVSELIETQPTRMEILKTVESSWTVGVTARLKQQIEPGPVRSVTKRVELPIYKRPPIAAEEVAAVERLQSRLAELRTEGAPAEDLREANRLVRRAAMDLMLARVRAERESLRIEIQAMQIGPAALVATPVEPFAEIGVEVKARSPFPFTLFSGYSNGAELYLPVAEAYEEGGYEVWMSPFAPAAAAIVVEESLKLLRHLHQQGE
ncbi:MAG: neutral/alkaline non-lysosomal ceramidase N-terminal domain-containing protein [Acidobacteriota bacterium]